MHGRAGRRGQAAQVGAIILFAFVVISFALYQAVVVPQQNLDVESQHNREVRNDMVDLRNVVLSAANGGQDAVVSVRLGTTYPTRAVALNPPPVTGTLRTTGDAPLVVQSGGTGGNQLDCAGAESTQLVEYRPSYNVFQRPPTTYYENTVVHNRFESGHTLETSQQVVSLDSGFVNLVAVRNDDLGRTGTKVTSVDVIRGATRSVEVSDPVVTMPTRLTQAGWEDLLEDEVPNPASVVTVRDTDGDARPDEVELDLTGEGEFTVYCTPVGVGSEPPSGAAGVAGPGGGGGGTTDADTLLWESFEDVSVGGFPSLWDREEPTDGYVNVSDGTADTGSQALEFESNDDGSAEKWATTPELDTSGYARFDVEFWYDIGEDGRVPDASDEIVVEYLVEGEDGSDPGDWVEIGVLETDESSPGEKEFVVRESEDPDAFYDGVRIRFRQRSTSSTDPFFLDDIGVVGIEG